MGILGDEETLLVYQSQRNEGAVWKVAKDGTGRGPSRRSSGIRLTRGTGRRRLRSGLTAANACSFRTVLEARVDAICIERCSSRMARGPNRSTWAAGSTRPVRRRVQS